jgi:hypothetical protein
MLSEAFTSHAAFEKLEQLHQVLISDGAKEKIPLNDAAFFEAVYKYTKDRLKLALPILVQEPEMTALANEVDAITVQINAFLGNNNIGHVTNATNNSNSVLNRIRNFPFPFSKGDFDFSKSIAGFEQAATNGFKNLETINNNLQQELKKAQDDLVAKQTQLTNLESKLAAKEVEIQNVLARYNTEFEALKTTANSDIEAEKKKFNDGIEADRKLYKEQFDADTESNKKSFDEQKSDFEKQSTEIIGNLNSKLSEANKIVNIVGNVGVTGNYQNIANQNKKTADYFRWVALGFMVIMSGLLIWSIIEISKNGEFNVYKSLVRILAAAVLTYPAVYAARESAKHRRLETQNRNLELELASIGPFIELLPEDKKQLIKEELANKYFGNHKSIADDKKEDEDVSINALERIFKAVLPFLKK